jgi:type I restriction enzyme S subunit
MVNTGATIGKLAIAKNIHETRNTTFQKSVAVIKVKRDTIDSVFLKYVFILRLASFSGKGSGSAIQNLLLSEMRRFKIIIPPLNFQTQFAERVQAIEEQKVKAQASLEKAEDLFNSLLQRAFNGELV